MPKIGEKVAVFITGVSSTPWHYTGECNCCIQESPETYARTGAQELDEGEPDILLAGWHPDLYGIHIVRALHPYYTRRRGDSNIFRWELVPLDEQ